MLSHITPLGWLVIGLLSSGGVGLFYFRLRKFASDPRSARTKGLLALVSRKFRAELDGVVLATCENSPSGFRLHIPEQQQIDCPTDWQVLAARRMSYLGRLHLAEENDSSYDLQLFLSDDSRLLAILLRGDGGQQWWQTHALDHDRVMLTWSAADDDCQVAWAAGRHRVHRAGQGLQSLLQAALPDTREGHRFPRKLMTMRKFYARALLETRFEHYLHSRQPHELRLLLPGNGRAMADETLVQVMEATARRQLPALCVTQYVYGTSGGAGEWSLVRDRLLVVHEHMQPRDLLDAGPWCRVTPDLGQVLMRMHEQPEPFTGRFQRLNALLPEARRYQQIGHISHPLDAVVYAAPKGA